MPLTASLIILSLLSVDVDWAHLLPILLGNGEGYTIDKCMWEYQAGCQVGISLVATYVLMLEGYQMRIY